jgi:hypothetical protein
MYKLLTDDHLEYADRSYVDESFGHLIQYIQMMTYSSTYLQMKSLKW